MSEPQTFRVKFNSEARDSDALSVARGDIVEATAGAETRVGQLHVALRERADQSPLPTPPPAGFVPQTFLAPISASTPRSRVAALAGRRAQRASWSPTSANAQAIRNALNPPADPANPPNPNPTPNPNRGRGGLQRRLSNPQRGGGQLSRGVSAGGVRGRGRGRGRGTPPGSPMARALRRGGSHIVRGRNAGPVGNDGTESGPVTGGAVDATAAKLFAAAGAARGRPTVVRPAAAIGAAPAAASHKSALAGNKSALAGSGPAAKTEPKLATGGAAAKVESKLAIGDPVAKTDKLAGGKSALAGSGGASKTAAPKADAAPKASVAPKADSPPKATTTASGVPKAALTTSGSRASKTASSSATKDAKDDVGPTLSGSASSNTSPRTPSAAKNDAAAEAARVLLTQLNKNAGGGVGKAKNKNLPALHLPAAWTSSRRTSPVQSPRNAYEAVLGDDSDSSDDEEVVVATRPDRKTPGATPRTPTSGRGGRSGDDDEDSASHSRFDMSELQELKNRLQAKKFKKSIKVRKIEYLNDDETLSSGDDQKTDKAAPSSDTGDERRRKSEGTSAPAAAADSSRPSSSGSSGGSSAAAAVPAVDLSLSHSKRSKKNKESSSSSKKNRPTAERSRSRKNLSLRRRRRNETGEPKSSLATNVSTATDDDDDAPESPRKTSSTRTAAAAAAAAAVDDKSRKSRTLPRNSLSKSGSRAVNPATAAASAAADAADSATAASSTPEASEDDIWAKLIADEKEKQMKRERRKRASGGDAAPAAADDDNKRSRKKSSRRKREKRSAEPDFNKVFSAASPEGSPREPSRKLESLGFVAVESSSGSESSESSDERSGSGSERSGPGDFAAVFQEAADEGAEPEPSFGALFQEEKADKARGVSFAPGTETRERSGSGSEKPVTVITRARSKSVSERIGLAKLSLQPITVSGKLSKDASEAAAAAAVAAVAAGATGDEGDTRDDKLAKRTSERPSPRPTSMAPSPTPLKRADSSKKGSSVRPKICQHCVARREDFPGRVAARVLTPDGVELFLCKRCTTEWERRAGDADDGADEKKAAAAAAAKDLAAKASGDGLEKKGSSRFSFFRKRNQRRPSARYKLERDADGNVRTIEKADDDDAAGGGVAKDEKRKNTSSEEAKRAAAEAAARMREQANASDAARRAAADGAPTSECEALERGASSGKSTSDNDGETLELSRSANDNRLRRELAQVQPRHAIGYDIGRRTDDIVVIIDPGTATTKIGFSGEAAPRAVFPTWVRYMEARKKPAGLGGAGSPFGGQPLIPIQTGTLEDRDGFIGEDPAVPKLRSFWKHPVERGVVRDWEEMEKLLEYSFELELKADPEDHPVLLTDGSPLTDKLQRERAVQIMFETFNVPSTYMALQSAMSLLACGDLTGLVVTVGDGVTCAVPIYEGYPIRHAIHTLDRAGADLTTHMVDLVNDAITERHDGEEQLEQLLFDSTSHSDRYQFEQLKKKFGYVTTRTLHDEDKLVAESRYKYEKTWETPDGRRLPLLHERYQAFEPLFAPSIIGGAQMHWLDETSGSTERRAVQCEGIHRLAYASVRKCDRSVRRALLSNIYLAGGSARMPGICERLQSELATLTSGTSLAKARINVTGGPAADEYSEWLGASLFATLSTFSSTVIQKSEYLEVGPEIVHRRVHH